LLEGNFKLILQLLLII